MRSETLPVPCGLSVMSVGWACRLHYEKTGKWPRMLVYHDFSEQELAATVKKELKMDFLTVGFRRNDLPEGMWFVSSDEYVVFGNLGW